MTWAFLAVNEPFLPAVARRYVARLSASPAFTGPLKVTMIWVTRCFLFVTGSSGCDRRMMLAGSQASKRSCRTSRLLEPDREDFPSSQFRIGICATSFVDHTRVGSSLSAMFVVPVSSGSLPVISFQIASIMGKFRIPIGIRCPSGRETQRTAIRIINDEAHRNIQ
jgi:hypothetical protein